MNSNKIQLKEKLIKKGFKMNYRIRATLNGPLLQIEDSETKDGVPTTTQKRKEEIYNGVVVKFPYFSGNGWRGTLHREIANRVMQKAIDKGIKLDATNFHLLSAGGGSNYQSQDLAVELKIRDLNPIASVFGLSLAVEGKLMVSDLDPIDKMYKERKDKTGYYSELIKLTSSTKIDSIKQNRYGYGKILSLEEVSRYIEEDKIAQEQRKDARETGEGSIKRVGIQSYMKNEYIIPGTVLNGYVGAKYKFTDIEKGMLLVGFTDIVRKRLGSTGNIAYGVVHYMITSEDEDGSEREVIITSKNIKNISNPIVECRFSDEEQKCINAFNEWLENITEENILLSNILVSGKK